jgi:methionine-rich copper-binding protein CopC
MMPPDNHVGRQNKREESMKSILKAGAAFAVVLSSVAANAQTTNSNVTTNTFYSALPVTVQVPAGNSDQTRPLKLSSADQYALGVGSKYSDSATSTGNTEDAKTSVSNSFTMTGNVTPDCSFYGGSDTAHDINLGQIGVRTGNGDNVSQAFNQRDDMTVKVNSATAGCNFNNKVTIAKDNGSAGLLNTDAGSFDPAQFTDRIPYSISASWTGADLGTKVTKAQSLTVTQGQGSNVQQGGAWRSAFEMNVTLPAQTNRALVAGKYIDKITVTLATS